MHRLVDLRAQGGEPGGCVLPGGRCHAEALRAVIRAARIRLSRGPAKATEVLGRGPASPAHGGECDEAANHQQHGAWLGYQGKSRAGYQRAQLLLSSPQRRALHAALDAALPLVQASPQARKVRWSLDVDPVDLY